MANLTGVGGMKQKNMIAQFSDKQIIRGSKDPENEKYADIKGYFVDVQLDQSGMTQKAAKEGKADSNPHLSSNKVQGKGKDGGEFVSHTEYYSKSQVDKMMSVGQSFTQPGKDGIGEMTAIAFKGDIQTRKDEKDGKMHVIVMTPKDVKDGMSPEDVAKVEKYNEQHPFGPSDTKNFGPKTLEKQSKIQAIAKANKPARPAPVPTKEAENQAQAPEADTEFAS